MFTKMVLPLLGGTPSVWNTCMVFFQAALLAGYLYAHAAPKWLGVRRQAAFHLGLLALIILTLPIGVSQGWTPPQTSNPFAWLLLLLLVSVGLPFFIVSTTAPLLQKWFSHSGHAAARDPYFLYGASNLGSMLALVGYPLLVEPYLRLKHQAWAWAGGYALLLGLIALCGATLWRSMNLLADNGEAAEAEISPPLAPPTLSRRAWWVLLAFAPSSLLLGVTNYLSTDIASVPLLWVIPLAIYLLTFVLVFARKPLLPHRIMLLIQPFLVIPIVMLFFVRSEVGSWQFFLLHLLAFFCIAMVCHGELMQARPPAAQLTEFYLWMSVGGVLGGIFNALVAPVVFSTVIEYPLIIVLACMLRPDMAPEGPQWYRQARHRRWLDLALPLGLAALLAGLSLGFDRVPDFQKRFALLLVSCLAGVLCYSFREHPRRFALGLGVIILAGIWYPVEAARTLHTERNFFGVLRVKQQEVDGYRVHSLRHGNTLHGAQFFDPARSREPLLYFHRTGPLGGLFAAFGGGGSWREVGIIGLGTGSIASYAQPGQHYTYYEIDPAVEQVARDPRYFTYLADCPAKVDVVLGDARLSLQGAPAGHHDLFILDAFSSDSIPLHLITREALALYLAKLKDTGIMAFHISNRYLDLMPVLGNLAREAGLACLVQEDRKLTEADLKELKLGSIWVVMARQPRYLAPLAASPGWRPLSGNDAAPWTDDFSNILTVFSWSPLNLQESYRALSAETVIR
jgi:hypothetical protein